MAGLPADADFRAAMNAYMRWAVDDVLGYAPVDAAVVPQGARIPRWGSGRARAARLGGPGLPTDSGCHEGRLEALADFAIACSHDHLIDARKRARGRGRRGRRWPRPRRSPTTSAPSHGAAESVTGCS